MNSTRSRSLHMLPDVSLVLPCYNPGPQLSQSLEQLDRFAALAPQVWEYVFVCDGCGDDSANVIRTWKPQRAMVRLVEYKPNRGKGYAVRQGLLAACAPYRLFTDIDLAYSFEDIQRVVTSLKNGSDVVIASRAHPGSEIRLTSKMLGYVYRRQVQSHLFGLLVRALLPLTFRDTQAGLKGLTEATARLIVPTLRCDGFGFDCELLTACVRRSIPIDEIPVCVYYDESRSTTGFRSTMSMIRELWRIRRDQHLPASPMHTELREAG